MTEMVNTADTDTSELKHGLIAIVNASYCVLDPQDLLTFSTDWTRRFIGKAIAMVMPADVTEVAAVMRLCTHAGVAVTIQGGNTGLVGGGVPASNRPTVILSTRRLTQLGEIDEACGQLTVGAGASLTDLQKRASDAGWYYGVNIASRDSATVGGTIATNAGGIRVCAYGMTRQQVVGVQAVLSDGTVIDHLGGLEKDNTGYNLTQLLVGSEGTLAVITAVRLRLHRPPSQSTTALIGVRSYHDALDLVAQASRSARLLAAEVMDAQGMRLVCAMTDLQWPLSSPDWQHALIIEVEGQTIDLPEDVDAFVPLDTSDLARLWQYRELQSEAASTLGVIHKLDVTLPLGDLQSFADEFHQLIKADPAVTAAFAFGHLADGNLHLEVAGPRPTDVTIDGQILELVTSYGGSISSEHGIGQAKAQYLSLSRSEAEIKAMQAIKKALDPTDTLSPGIIFAQWR